MKPLIKGLASAALGAGLLAASAVSASAAIVCSGNGAGTPTRPTIIRRRPVLWSMRTIGGGGRTRDIRSANMKAAAIGTDLPGRLGRIQSSSIAEAARRAASFFKDGGFRLVILELRHRFQLVLGCVEDRVVGIPLLIRRALGPIGTVGLSCRCAGIVSASR